MGSITRNQGMKERGMERKVIFHIFTALVVVLILITRLVIWKRRTSPFHEPCFVFLSK